MRLSILAILSLGLLASCRQETLRPPDGIWLTEVGSGPASVIVLHGGPGLTHRYLRPEWDQLADVVRLIYYDQRSCGDSERTDSVSWQRHVADLDSIVLSARLEGPVVLAGSSWGATLAVLYAYSHPGRVDALVLSGVPDLGRVFWPEVVRKGDPGLRPGLDSAVSHGDSTMLYQGDSLLLKVTVGVGAFAATPAPVLDSAAVAADTGSIVPELAARIGMACLGVMGAVRRSLSNSAPSGDSFTQVDLPVLIIRGSEATVVGDDSERLAKSLADARVETIPEAEHDPWFDQPAVFFRIVRGFLLERGVL